MAESDEWATVETVDDGFENGYSQPGPAGVDQGVYEKIIELIFVINPWYVVLIGVSLYYLWARLRPLNSSGSSFSYPTQNPDEILARQEAQEAARRKLQEQYDQKAREAALKQKEKEEIARQEKLKNLEKYGSAYGRKLTATEPTIEVVGQGLASKKKAEKPKLRPEYNPLMGGGSSGTCFRPTRRGGGAGGG